MSDHDETTPDHRIVCRRFDQLETTIKEAYAMARAAEWVLKRFPRVP